MKTGIVRGIVVQGLVVTALAMAATACVTINIYFPAAAAERVADQVIDEVWNLGNPASTPAGETAPKTGEQP